MKDLLTKLEREALQACVQYFISNGTVTHKDGDSLCRKLDKLTEKASGITNWELCDFLNYASRIGNFDLISIRVNEDWRKLIGFSGDHVITKCHPFAKTIYVEPGAISHIRYGTSGETIECKKPIGEKRF